MKKTALIEPFFAGLVSVFATFFGWIQPRFSLAFSPGPVQKSPRKISKTPRKSAIVKRKKYRIWPSCQALQYRTFWWLKVRSYTNKGNHAVHKLRRDDMTDTDARAYLSAMDTFDHFGVPRENYAIQTPPTMDECVCMTHVSMIMESCTGCYDTTTRWRRPIGWSIC